MMARWGRKCCGEKYSGSLLIKGNTKTSCRARAGYKCSGHAGRFGIPGSARTLAGGFGAPQCNVYLAFGVDSGCV